MGQENPLNHSQHWCVQAPSEQIKAGEWRQRRKSVMRCNNIHPNGGLWNSEPRGHTMLGGQHKKTCWTGQLILSSGSEQRKFYRSCYYTKNMNFKPHKAMMNNVRTFRSTKGKTQLATTDRQYTVEPDGPAVLPSLSGRTKSWFRATQGGMALMSTIRTNKISMSKFS